MANFFDVDSSAEYIFVNKCFLIFCFVVDFNKYFAAR